VVSDLSLLWQLSKRGIPNHLQSRDQSHHLLNHALSRLLKRNHVQPVTRVQAHGQVALPDLVPRVILDHLANQGHHHQGIEIEMTEEDLPLQGEESEKKGPNLLKLTACM